MFGQIFAGISVIDTTWAVYTHTNGETGQTLWAGKCRTCDLTKFPDARKNREWVKQVLFAPKIITTIEALVYGELEANRELFRIIERLRPIINKQYTPQIGRKQPERTPVQCEQTGVIYINAASAADSLGVARATMSAHLNGNPAFRTVRGMSYIRVKPGTIQGTAPQPDQGSDTE